MSVASPTIAFVTTTPTSVREGSGTHVGISVLRQALIARGYAVPLLAPAPGWRPLGHTVQRLAFNLSVGRQVAAVHADLLVGFDLDGFLRSRRQAPPQVAAIKGIIADELTYESWEVRISLGLQALAEHLHVARAPLVLATSAFARERLSYHYGVPLEKIRVVPEPIDRGLWDPLLQAAPLRSSERFTVLCVAHMYPRKSIGTLLSAMAHLRETQPTARLRLVGHGPEEQHLRRFASRLGLEGTVEFLGHLTLRELAAEYRNADAFCLPSRQEGFGIVFLEAMAAGLPIVACQAAAVPEVVIDGTTGLLVPPLSPQALARALERLANDHSLRRMLGENGRRHTMLYTPERIATAFLAAISEVRLLPGAHAGLARSAS